MTRLGVTALATALAMALTGAARAEERSLPAVTVEAVANEVVRDTVMASGLIQPVEQVLVQPQIEGQAIDALLADVGDTVAAGQPLARLSTRALELQRSQLAASRAAAEASLAQAGAQLVEAQATADEALAARERTVALRQRGNASAAAEDQAVAAATSAEARVSVATQGLAAAEAQLDLVDGQIADVELNLQRTQVAAPVAGVVVARNAMLGAIASATGDPMFVIVRDGVLELRADVAEQDLLRLEAGQKATMRAVGVSAPMSGTVRVVEPAVDVATRLGRVRIALDRPETVRSGLFAAAEILVAEHDAPAIAASAVSTSDEGAWVLTVGDDGQVARRSVVTGIRDGGLVEIVDGLAPGDRVVSRAGAFVRAGDRVNPVMQDGEELAHAN